MSALTALLLASQAASTAWLNDVMQTLASACIERSVPTAAVAITRDELPGVLRGHVRRASSGEFHRFEGSERPSYLLQIANPRRDIASACGIAVPNRRRLQVLFNAAWQLQPRANAAFGRTYNIEAKIVGDWVVVQIAHHADTGDR
jgi:hypothetical protein